MPSEQHLWTQNQIHKDTLNLLHRWFNNEIHYLLFIALFLREINHLFSLSSHDLTHSFFLLTFRIAFHTPVVQTWKQIWSPDTLNLALTEHQDEGNKDDFSIKEQHNLTVDWITLQETFFKEVLHALRTRIRYLLLALL